MSKRKIATIIKYLVECVEKGGVTVTRAVVFGSQARGTAGEDSDIDVIIVSEDFRGKNIFKRVDMVNEAHILTIKKFVVPLDILLKTPEEAGHLSPSNKDEKIVFAA